MSKVEKQKKRRKVRNLIAYHACTRTTGGPQGGAKKTSNQARGEDKRQAITEDSEE